MTPVESEFGNESLVLLSISCVLCVLCYSEIGNESLVLLLCSAPAHRTIRTLTREHS